MFLVSPSDVLAAHVVGISSVSRFIFRACRSWEDLRIVSPARIVTVSYRWNLNPERISNEDYSGPGDDLLVIVSGEGPDGASSRLPSSPGSPTKEFALAFERAEVGQARSVELDSGFILVKWSARGRSGWLPRRPSDSWANR